MIRVSTSQKWVFLSRWCKSMLQWPKQMVSFQCGGDIMNVIICKLLKRCKRIAFDFNHILGTLYVVYSTRKRVQPNYFMVWKKFEKNYCISKSKQFSGSVVGAIEIKGFEGIGHFYESRHQLSSFLFFEIVTNCLQKISW